MDKIIIKNLRIYAYHGVNPEEKVNGQLFSFDIECNLSMTKACYSDLIDDTVNYAKIVKSVKRTVLSEKYNLLEKVCQLIVDNLFEEFEMIDSIKIKMTKPEAPIKADFDYVAVEIERDRK